MKKKKNKKKTVVGNGRIDLDSRNDLGENRTWASFI